MKNFNLFTPKDCAKLTNGRKGESKFGEHIQLIPNLTNIYDSISVLDVDYVVFGIKEDIGIYANYGKPGASRAWDATVKVLLNVQNNRFNQADKVLILGHLEYSGFKEALTKPGLSHKKSIKEARKMVEEIDKDVTYLVNCIIRAGKMPVIIGGGHNNSYGNIKGAALALNKKINVVNFDAHSDFRPEEGRHSGNGFSYAYAEGFLKYYFIFGLHKNYTSEPLFKTLNKLKDIQYASYEDMELNTTLGFQDALEAGLKHVNNNRFGLEVDCDAIERMPSSAMTPSGFSSLQARQFVNFYAKQPNVTYLHICEAAPTKKKESQVGKIISYLITDFIRAKEN
jgi:formiminoglutamase